MTLAHSGAVGWTRGFPGSLPTPNPVICDVLGSPPVCSLFEQEITAPDSCSQLGCIGSQSSRSGHS